MLDEQATDNRANGAAGGEAGDPDADGNGALPLVAAPITADLNNQHIQHLGDEAVRFYEGFGKAQK